MFEAYRRAQKAAESPRAEEYRRLGELTAGLMAANSTKDPQRRAKALQDNQRFWHSLKLSSVSAVNSLPPALRAQFVSLADWVERESVLAALGKSGLSDLIAVNRQIMEGLKPYTGQFAADQLRVAN